MTVTPHLLPVLVWVLLVVFVTYLGGVMMDSTSVKPQSAVAAGIGASGAVGPSRLGRYHHHSDRYRQNRLQGVPL